jgi:hypothetical protein
MKTDSTLVKLEAAPPNQSAFVSGKTTIKSRKENMQESTGASDLYSSSIDITRKAAQPFTLNPSGMAKRQRIVTPAAFKVIDEEDEPRTSPTRKVTQTVSAADGERRALSGIEPNVL